MTFIKIDLTTKKNKIMKTSNIVIAALLFATIVTQSCTKEFSQIEGIGTITTETLTLQEFSGIAMEGADNVIISYGPEQKVEVTGHSNIINRIQTEVTNGIWYMELERGNYGRYELTYKITLPSIEKIHYEGSGNVMVSGPMEVETLELSLMGSCNFSGFSLRSQSCQVDITGTGNCEITAGKTLDVSIDGSGNVYYKGAPSIKNHISGSGSVIDSN
jgi:hypothetical protein